MTDQEREILFSLADTMRKTRAELDATRTILFSVASTLSNEAALLPQFVQNLQANIDRDEAISVGSPMDDEMLALRAKWLRQFLLPHVQQMLRLP